VPESYSTRSGDFVTEPWDAFTTSVYFGSGVGVGVGRTGVGVGVGGIGVGVGVGGIGVGVGVGVGVSVGVGVNVGVGPVEYSRYATSQATLAAVYFILIYPFSPQPVPQLFLSIQ